jgi:transcriptional regulator with XRE-family HTH domain
MENFIKEIRKSQGLSLEDLAQKIGTTPQQINFLENGKRKLTWDWMQRIANGLECHPIDLVEGPASTPTAKDATEADLLKKFRGLEDGAKRIFSHMLNGLDKEATTTKLKGKKDDDTNNPARKSK